ncbi:tuliposide A-converting enzyme 1, chloroplastic-like [Typha latifolia]|uniref:tuliposide A-converting enzyme 1, chloroplastic-like n=1 Tax=Typha latifolia TaxID=4733 RepID=UPI003C2C48EB
MDPNSELQTDFSPLIRTYKSGRVERLLGTAVLPAGLDPTTHVTSKDVVIDPTVPVSARLYLPQNSENTTQRLPLLVYFHGGGFVIESSSSPTYHDYLNSLVSKANIIAVSVEYRLAPEHPLPAAYDDCLTATSWALSGSDPWLAEHADLDRVYLGGDSAGGNIVHNVVWKDGVRAKGVLLVHPWFFFIDAAAAQGADTSLARGLKLWRFACPGSGVVDDPRMNPMAKGAPSFEKLPTQKVMVCVAEKDGLRDCGKAYHEELKKCGWKGQAEFLESEGMDHVFHLRNPACEQAREMMDRVVAFISSD